MSDEPLFELPAPAPLRRPKSPIVAAGPMRWSPYNPVHPRRCDDCMQVALEGWRDGDAAPLARQARHKLSVANKTIAFVCGEHKQIRVEGWIGT